ncbi:hypothetical protein L1049_001396 [Liquidambar formosana]|uniref:Uncharacterized protein n=1 Tax=Liquidambar formosana TaxID=63359 RepID=A0AAP0NE65_LIQFO
MYTLQPRPHKNQSTIFVIMTRNDLSIGPPWSQPHLITLSTTIPSWDALSRESRAQNNCHVLSVPPPSSTLASFFSVWTIKFPNYPLSLRCLLATFSYHTLFKIRIVLFFLLGVFDYREIGLILSLVGVAKFRVWWIKGEVGIDCFVMGLCFSEGGGRRSIGSGN